MTAEELHGEAWLAALDIGHRIGRDLDFGNPADQQLILGALWVEHVKRGDWELRRALRLDREPDDGDEGISLIEHIPDAAMSDPLTLLEMREAWIEEELALASSYSQAAAYIVVFAQFGNDRVKICAWLVISDSALYARMRRAFDTVRTQASLFDRVETIPENFMPPQGWHYLPKVEEIRKPEQIQLSY